MPTGEVEWVCQVEHGAVRAFARAIGDDHWQADGLVPPPTFPVVLSADYVERLVTEILALDRSRSVHGEQEYDYVRPLVPGETVRCRAGIIADEIIAGRRGGRMRRIVCEIALTTADGDAPIGTERMTTLVLGEPDDKDVAS